MLHLKNDNYRISVTPLQFCVKKVKANFLCCSAQSVKTHHHQSRTNFKVAVIAFRVPHGLAPPIPKPDVDVRGKQAQALPSWFVSPTSLIGIIQTARPVLPTINCRSFPVAAAMI